MTKLEIRDQCRCSEEKVQSALENFKQRRFTKLSDKMEISIVVCEFCKVERNFLNN